MLRVRLESGNQEKEEVCAQLKPGMIMEDQGWNPWDSPDLVGEIIGRDELTGEGT